MSENYEAVSILYNPLVTRLQQALEVVKKFIIDNNLIITGGMAIDYALKLRGDKIYDESSAASLIPDWDFYSPNHVVHAYELADKLYELGFGAGDGDPDKFRIDAIRATHITTIRVRIAREVVADITYIAPDIFNKLPYLTIRDLRVIHPHWQLMNIHRSLSFLFENPPREVVFSRMVKDIKRGNQLYTLYPLQKLVTPVEFKFLEWPQEIANIFKDSKDTDSNFISDTKYGTVLYGFAAYAAIYNAYKKLMPDKLDGIQSCNFNAKGFDSVEPLIELIITDPDVVEKLRQEGWEEYEEFIDYERSYFQKELKGDKPITIRYYYLSDTFIGTASYQMGDGLNAYLPPANLVLLYFLLHYNRNQENPLYGQFYTSLLEMCNRVNQHIDSIYNKFPEYVIGSKSLPKEVSRADNILFTSPFFSPKRVYGSSNISHSSEMQLFEIGAKLSKIMNIPFNVNIPPAPDRVYNPTGIRTHEPFDYNSSRYFRMSGARIKNQSLFSILK